MKFSEKYISSRVDRSKETLDEAQLMFDNGHYLSVINRLYYSVFYLACAYLGKENIITRAHSGTKNKFHEVYVKTGIVDEDFGKIYSRLFSERNESDYGDFENLSKDDAKALLSETGEVLKKYWNQFEQFKKKT